MTRRRHASARSRLAVVVVAAATLAGGCTASEPSSGPEPTTEPGSPPTPTVGPSPTHGTSPSEAPSAEATETPSDPPDETALDSMGVSAGDPAAVEAGTEVLADGGSAVDAAIATAFAVSVVEPFASGVGGGGATLVVPTVGDEEPQAYDYREVVPDDGVVPPGGTGVPGFVAGMAELHADHGRLEWSRLLEPAIELASDGHPVSEVLAGLLDTPTGRQVAAENPQFTTGGTPLGEGETLVQDELAATLGVLADEGADAFYTGTLSSDLAAAPGLDPGSLAGYQVVRSQPARGALGDHEVLAAAPPLPGAALVQQLQVAEALGVADLEPGTADHTHRLAGAWQVADGTAQTLLGDPAFVDVPLDEITDPGANAELAGALPIDPSVDGPAPAGPAPAVPERADLAEAGNTTHVSVVDADGLAVSMTNTITHFWGSGQSVGGFFLNDQLTRFEAIGTTDANEPAPGRRSVSWSIPAVVVDGEDRPVLAIGTPGGRRIPNILTGVVARWVLHDQSLEEAVAAPRAHAEGQILQMEAAPDAATADALAGLGYSIEVPDPEDHVFGSVQALAIDHGAREVRGAEDTRRDGTFTVVDR
ncbi:gamma-glutamyltransferase family protein [Georgenia sp. Z1491]|uniref:gamma-glutamyltransferase family protein n=1 Tax=Georgenia sp. Z1491 TaxID=3416707 RepID=UPI003CE95BB6